MEDYSNFVYAIFGIVLYIFNLLDYQYEICVY